MEISILLLGYIKLLLSSNLSTRTSLFVVLVSHSYLFSVASLQTESCPLGKTKYKVYRYSNTTIYQLFFRGTLAGNIFSIHQQIFLVHSSLLFLHQRKRNFLQQFCCKSKVAGSVSVAAYIANIQVVAQFLCLPSSSCTVHLILAIIAKTPDRFHSKEQCLFNTH